MEHPPENSTGLIHSFVIGMLIAVSGILAIEIGLSVAVLEIVMGFFARNVVHIYEADWLNFIADFGLITIMFIAGFEVDAPMLKRNLGKSTAVGLISFIVPFGGIYGACLLLGLDHQKAALFAIGLSTTSLAMVFPSLKERGLLKSDEGQFLLSSAMIVDIISIIALLVFFITPSWNLALGAVLVILVFTNAPKLSNVMFGRWKGNLIEMEVRFILFLLLALLFIAELSNVHAALTGFIFGMVMSRLLKKHFEVEEKLRNIVFSFFAPVFFFKAGTQMDISNFHMRDVALFALFTPLAFGLKYISTYFPFRQFRCSLYKYAATLFNYRLSFAIVTAMYGLEEGIIEPGEYAALMAVVLATSLGTAFILKFRTTDEWVDH